MYKIIQISIKFLMHHNYPAKRSQYEVECVITPKATSKASPHLRSLRQLRAIRINKTNAGASRFGKQRISQPEPLPQATCPAEAFFQPCNRNNNIPYQTMASFGKYFCGCAHGTSFSNIVFGHRNENGPVFKRALHLHRPSEAGVCEREPHSSKSWLVCQGTKTAAVPLWALPHEEQGTTHDERTVHVSIHIAAASLLKGLQFSGFRAQAALRHPVYFTGLQSLAATSTARTTARYWKHPG